MIWLPSLALTLDLLLADPKSLPHPVQAIGLLARLVEKPARRMKNLVLAGTLAVFFLLTVTGIAVALLTSLPQGLGLLFSLYFAWSGLALGGLIREGRKALAAIELAEKEPRALAQARRAVQMLVSRDTGAMEISELYRSVAESVSENLNDAFVAPWFWLCLGGPVGLWLYKVASTMDSMWGYNNERWGRLGRTAALLDDVLAFVPARLSVLIMVATAWMERLPWQTEGFPGLARHLRGRERFSLPGWPGFAALARQARKSASPNAGWPMATAAWLFNGRTGGSTVYDGVIVIKPQMGPQDGRWEAQNTEDLILHVQHAGWAVLASGILLALPLSLL